MTTGAERKLMTADELLLLPRGIKRYELIRGSLIQYPLNVAPVGLAASHISYALARYSDSNDYGRTAIGCGYWLERDPDTVRAATITWVAPRCIPKGTQGYPELAPDLAVEVKSCSTSHPEITANAYMWLSYGSQQVWVADPPTATITIFRLNTAPVTLSEDDVLDGGELLPGFSTSVWRLFRRRR